MRCPLGRRRRTAGEPLSVSQDVCCRRGWPALGERQAGLVRPPHKETFLLPSRVLIARLSCARCLVTDIIVIGPGRPSLSDSVAELRGYCRARELDQPTPVGGPL